MSNFLLGIEWGWYADGPVKELERVHPVEAVFVVVTFGFMLDEFAASKEHGWTGELFIVRPDSPSLMTSLFG